MMYFRLNCLMMVAEKMSKTPENDTVVEVQSNNVLATDDKQESQSPSNSPHIEVPVGSLAVQDTLIENQPDAQPSESQMTIAEEVAGTGTLAPVTDQNVTEDDNDNVSERQLIAAERQEEPADEMVTNMSVQVRSGCQVAEQMSVACGEGAERMSEAHIIKNDTDVKSSSPILQYSSDAAATGLSVCAMLLEIFVKKLHRQLLLNI